MLQLDEELIEECKNNAFETAIETNGTIPIDFNIDWVCVSPKYGSELVVKHGNELKTVFPQEGQNFCVVITSFSFTFPSFESKKRVLQLEMVRRKKVNNGPRVLTCLSYHRNEATEFCATLAAAFLSFLCMQY